MSAIIGEEVTYWWKNRKGVEREVTGKIQEIDGGYTIRNIDTGERFEGVKLKIKPNDGSRAIWTQAMRKEES